MYITIIIIFILKNKIGKKALNISHQGYFSLIVQEMVTSVFNCKETISNKYIFFLMMLRIA